MRELANLYDTVELYVFQSIGYHEYTNSYMQTGCLLQHPKSDSQLIIAISIVVVRRLR